MGRAARRRDGVAGDLPGVFDAGLLAALCEPVRLDVLRVLVGQGRADVRSIAERLPQDRSVVSRHLAILHRAGVVRREKRGRQVFFELDGRRLLDRLGHMVDGCRRLVASCCPPQPKRRRT